MARPMADIRDLGDEVASLSPKELEELRIYLITRGAGGAAAAGVVAKPKPKLPSLGGYKEVADAST